MAKTDGSMEAPSPPGSSHLIPDHPRLAWVSRIWALVGAGWHRMVALLFRSRRWRAMSAIPAIIDASPPLPVHPNSSQGIPDWRGFHAAPPLPLPVHPTSSQGIPDWRRLRKGSSQPLMPQMRPASDRDQVMILHFLFAVKRKVITLHLLLGLTTPV